MGSKSLAVLLLFPALISCGEPDPFWCEFDDTDQVVDDEYCYDEIPGYEWESGKEDKGVIFTPPVKHGQTYQAPRYQDPRTRVPTYKAPPPVYKAPAPAPYKPPPPAPKPK